MTAEVHSNIAASEKGSRGKRGMLKMMLEESRLLQNLVGFVDAVVMYERVQVWEQSRDRKCICWSRKSRASGEKKPTGRLRIQSLDLELSSGVFTASNSRKKKVLFLWSITFNHHVTCGNR